MNRNKKELILDWLIVLAVAALLFLISSCTPQKRLNRLIDRHPYLTETDTIKIKDTVRINVPGVRVDSTVSLNDVQHDTLVIRNEQLTVKTIYNNDSIYISGECDTIRDTLIREIRMPTEKIIYRRPRDALSWYHWVVIALGVLFVIIIAVKIIK